MFFILSKILLFLLRPFFWFCAFLLLAFIANSERRKKQFFVSAICILLFFANIFIVSEILNLYEPSYPKGNKNYDVGVVLGGFSGLNKRNNEIKFGGASDRLLQAISLYKKGRIGKILLSSGNANLIDTKVKEADLATEYLKLIGIPDSAIIVENLSRNTVENAKFSLNKIEVLKPGASVLVITSAWHIPRAKLIFNKNSTKQIDYYPTDFRGETDYEPADYFLPNSTAFDNWNILLKEWVGLVVVKIRS